MPRYARVICGLLVLAAIATTGCARAARDTSGFAVHKDATVAMPFDEAWQAVKGSLREQGYELYTRDKRGTFVAYTDMHRILLIQPSRIKYTVTLTPVNDKETAVTVDAVRQKYGATLPTYPGWHDRPLKDEAAAAALLESVQAKLNGAPVKTEDAGNAAGV